MSVESVPHHPQPPHVAGERPPTSPDLAMFLATEHWSLLGTRSMTWSEVMSRINIQFALTSACLVVLALVAPATGFGTNFLILAIGLTATILVMGSLTVTRVMMASEEDAHLVLGMNRLRAAYVELAPEMRPYLSASTYDDDAGLMSTYALGVRRSTPAHVMASTAFFLQITNTIVAGVLGALIAAAAGVSVSGRVWIGVGAAALHFGIHFYISVKTFGGRREVRFPTPAELHAEPDADAD